VLPRRTSTTERVREDEGRRENAIFFENTGYLEWIAMGPGRRPGQSERGFRMIALSDLQKEDIACPEEAFDMEVGASSEVERTH
jgi:hypothetical protein